MSAFDLVDDMAERLPVAFCIRLAGADKGFLTFEDTVKEFVDGFVVGDEVRNGLLEVA